jgi:ABC-type amino acid transport substrate-binding protein
MNVAFSHVAAIAAAFPLSAGGAAAGQDTCAHLVVAGHPRYAPVSWAVGDTLQGGAIALVEKLAAAEGVSVSVLNAGSWDGAQQAVETGKADLIVGIYKTPAREGYLDFVPPACPTTPRLSSSAGTRRFLTRTGRA